MAETKNLNAVYSYAVKHLEAYKTGGVSEDELNADVLKMANDFGFISDHGISFDQKYCNDEGIPIFDMDELKALLSKVTDITDVGSLYVSWWREVTHFSEGNPFEEEHRNQFVTILERLEELTGDKA